MSVERARSKAATAANRRSEPRFPANAPVEVSITYPVAQGHLAGTVIDISKSGLRLRMDTSLPKSSRVQVKLGEVMVFGEVRHCREVEDGVFEAGIRIEDMLTRGGKPNKHNN